MDKRKYSEDDIKRKLSGNLCRCTGYTGIVTATLEILDYYSSKLDNAWSWKYIFIFSS